MVNCNECKRIFKSKNAMEQHKRSCHQMVARSGPRTRGARRRFGNAGGGADINPSKTRAVPGSVISLSGEDRLGLVTVAKDATTFNHFDITSGSSLRLGNIAKAYQRIKWDMVSVTVTPQVAVTVSGGYVCGFIMDPSDRAVTARQLSSAQGSQTRKWYESVTVRMPPKRELLYTSAGTEPRLSQPCVFWIVTEGPPTSTVPIVVTMNWRVTLSEPTVEGQSDKSFVLAGTLVPKQNNYNLQYIPPGGSATDDCSKGFENFKDEESDCYFRVPTFLIEYSEGTGDTGTVQAHFVVYSPSDKKCYYSASGTKRDTTTWQGDINIQVVVPCGTFLKYEGSKNPCRGDRSSPPLSQSQELTTSKKESSSYSRLASLMEELLLKLETTSESDFVNLTNE